MPWNETSAMDQRMHFIADYLEDYWFSSVSGLV